MRYANPLACPDCRATLPTSAWSCPSCDLPLHGPLAVELFRTLERADVLLSRLRTEATVAPVPAPVPEPGPATQRAAATLLDRTGLRTASVPAILLGLGALCLLVAAITFLAVAWSWLGIGGRTGVLVGLTAAALAAGRWLGRRGLRIAAESLTAVALGLVGLDLTGAITAGWLGSPDDGGSVALVGAGVAVVAGVLVLTKDRLVVPQLGTVIGVWTSALGLAVSTGHDQVVAAASVVLLAGIAAASRAIGTRVLLWSATIAAGTWWLWLLLTGLEHAGPAPSLDTLWIGGDAVPLLAAAALLLLPTAVLRDGSIVLRVGVSGAATLVTFLLALPGLDEGRSTVAAVSLVTLLAWSLIGLAVPRSWRRTTAGPIALATIPALSFVILMIVVAAGVIATVADPFTQPLGVRLPDTWPTSEPVLLVPLIVAMLLAAWVLWPRTPVRTLGTVAVAVGGVATLASYPVPLAAVVGVLVVLALATAAVGTRSPVRSATAAATAAAAVLSALPSAGLTAVACAGAVVVGGVLATRTQRAAALSGGLLLPAAAAGLVWSLTEVTDVEVVARAVPVLLVVGLLALARPRIETEIVAVLAGLLATTAALDAAADRPTALAVHLTIAGLLVTASSLLHPRRRVLAWPGGLLLAAATWVRLADLGVEAPEAYTLPSAVVLILVALHRLWRVPATSTAVLLPGLMLATVPSLLWVLVDPVSVRAVLLGVACLGLVLTGAQLRWSAPLATGGVVGALLVVREVAPYASAMPQWVLIGFAGTILTVVGVTWERRVLELRRATTYLGRLR